MKLSELYRKAVALGMDNDPRGPVEVSLALEKAKEAKADLKEDELPYFDEETLGNPYADTRILCGDPGSEVSTALVGVDMEIGEVLLADRLRENGEAIDLIIAHHPEGTALARLGEVMGLQADVWARYGVSINVAEALMDKRIAEVKRNFMPINHQRAVDAARALGIPMMCIHTAADNMVTTYLQKRMDEASPRLVKDVIKLLLEEPEYRKAKMEGAGPTVVQGREDGRCGRVVIDMTGGTEGSNEMLQRMAVAGVGTLVQMHASEKYREEAEKQKVNIVIAGHIASDVIGLNLLFDELEKDGLKIVPCSGFTRFKR